jgi:FAD/FMN-containing dehydrogenase
VAGRGLTAAALAAVAGDRALADETADGLPRVAPVTVAGAARLLRTASVRGWAVRVEHDDWSTADAPADVVLSTRGLHAITDCSPADQVVTAQAGASFARLAEAAPWFAADPPGRARTLGGALALGGGGPLIAGYGPLRDQVLGLTAVTGDGRTLTVGGRVLKNVAGYDLAKLFIGGGDAFGVVVAAHLRLRAPPRYDVTATWTGTRDAVSERAMRLLEAGERPAALELVWSAATWTLAVRRHAPVRVGADEPTLGVDEAGAFWGAVAAGHDAPVVLRIGTVPDGVDTALALLADHLPPPVALTASVFPGRVRWSGSADAGRLTALRQACAHHEMPLTLERAPWAVRQAVGMHGAYRDGIAPLVDGLRAAFDPAGVLRA